ALAEHIDKFNIQNEDDRIKLANIVVEKAPRVLAEHIDKFNIENEDERIKIAFLIAIISPCKFVENIDKFNIQNEDARIRLGNRVVKKDPMGFLRNIDKFKIVGNKKFELEKKAVLKIPYLAKDLIAKYEKQERYLAAAKIAMLIPNEKE